jgi:hypothetical protein
LLALSLKLREIGFDLNGHLPEDAGCPWVGQCVCQPPKVCSSCAHVIERVIAHAPTTDLGE